MSQKLLTQTVEYTCEGCGEKKVFEMINPTSADITEMGKYFMIVRNVVFEGELHQLKAQACSLDCVPVVAAKLMAVASEEAPADKIDLAALQVNGPKN